MRPVWVDDALRAEPDAVVSVFDHGLTVGDGVFETVKVDRGEPFALTRHLERLSRSARGLGLPDPDLELVRKAVGEVLAGQPDRLARLRLRITFTGGVSPLGSDRGNSGPTLVVAAVPRTPWASSAAVVTVPWPRNERGPIAGLKTTSYAENVVALAYAKKRGASEAICADTAGRLCEGTGSNVVVAIDGQLVTPTLATGCLAGVTRALVLEWCDVIEGDLPIGVLTTANEIFLMSTTRDIQPVHRVDDRRLDAPGPLTRTAMKIWAARSSEHSDP
jgi:branched-chain amino acid aminotransferase